MIRHAPEDQRLPGGLDAKRMVSLSGSGSVARENDLSGYLRPIPSTLRKKLERTTWIPKVSDTNPGMTILSVISGSREPK
jgi:hypothetical protein